eukprot:TRINITY_DN8910_c1_g1_i1.p1 TRINITY_DN8910_c1_g1~~TRINITY_DN8910_c1_g1_i1.p1  ORF type:complete len:297 (-),score=64.16 TRINITY_DN8910_c1_g1_i1:89-913(-)
MASRQSSSQRASQIVAPEIVEGARVQVLGKYIGTVKFIGTTEFADGKWVGIGLDTPAGKNDGSVKGKQYFSCEANHGLFVSFSSRPGALVPLPSAAAAATPQKLSTVSEEDDAADAVTSAAPEFMPPSRTSTTRPSQASAATSKNLTEATSTNKLPRSMLSRSSLTSESDGDPILLDAKAELSEILSNCCSEVQHLNEAVKRLGSAVESATTEAKTAAAAVPDEGFQKWLPEAGERLSHLFEEKLSENLSSKLRANLAGTVAEIHRCKESIKQG